MHTVGTGSDATLSIGGLVVFLGVALAVMTRKSRCQKGTVSSPKDTVPKVTKVLEELG
jgi:hypothetical protein